MPVAAEQRMIVEPSLGAALSSLFGSCMKLLSGTAGGSIVSNARGVAYPAPAYLSVSALTPRPPEAPHNRGKQLLTANRIDATGYSHGPVSRENVEVEPVRRDRQPHQAHGLPRLARQSHHHRKLSY